MNIGLHHLFYTCENNPDILSIRKDERFKTLVNSSVYLFGAIGLIVTIPQLTNIWIGKDVGGVSLITWIGFFIAALFWTAYGFLHRSKPIFLINLTMSLLDLIIILGIFLYR